MKKSIIKRLLVLTVFAALVLSLTTPVMAEFIPEEYVAPIGDIKTDTWVAVDGLGRTVNTYAEVGDVREGKFVGLFYWTWHLGQSNGQQKAINVTQVIREHPEAVHDFNHSVWSGYSGMPHFWDEPLFGYYITSDDYVLRKHAEMLADAGVDVIIFDCTNATETWKSAYENLFEVFRQAKAEGVDVPQVAFMLNFAANSNTLVEIRQLYKDIYSKGRYQDLWFYWEGKPLIMAWKDALKENNKTDAEILDFFTFRENRPSYFEEDRTIDEEMWGWCSVYPQTKYGVREDGSVEQMTVNVAQNASEHGLVAMNDYRGGVFGRAYSNNENGKYSYKYTYKNQEIVVDSDIENAYYYGINFQQQWDYALEVDPDFIFITGWNEWIAGRWEEWQGTSNAFPDQYNDEYSRDIEPSKGDLKDYYYYQMISNIRKYKGVSKPEIASKDNNANKTIDINSTEDQWADVTLEFNHYADSTIERDYKGWGTKLRFESNTMRNDFVQSKVAYDDEYVYFMVQTVEDITASSDPAWMRLLIDTDFTGITENWEGFEYIINRVSPNGNQAVIEKSTGGWNFQQCGTAEFTVSGNRLQIAVPRSALGLGEGASIPAFNFKWADNNRIDGATEDSGDILDFYSYGDVAPGGRFMFAFRSDETQVVPPAADPVTENGGMNTTTILIIVLVAVVIVCGGAIFAVLKLTSKPAAKK